MNPKNKGKVLPKLHVTSQTDQAAVLFNTISRFSICLTNSRMLILLASFFQHKERLRPCWKNASSTHTAQCVGSGKNAALSAWQFVDVRILQGILSRFAQNSRVKLKLREWFIYGAKEFSQASTNGAQFLAHVHTHGKKIYLTSVAK